MDDGMKEVLAGVALEAESDWVWVSTVAEEVLALDEDAASARHFVESAVARMISSGAFVPGDCHPAIRGEEGLDAVLPPREAWFSPWAGEPMEWLARIFRELDESDLRGLRPFDIATFVPSGSDHARS